MQLSWVTLCLVSVSGICLVTAIFVRPQRWQNSAAHATIVAGGITATIFTPNWASALIATLFVALIVFPWILRVRFKNKLQRAVDSPEGAETGLIELESKASKSDKPTVRQWLAVEQCDWEKVLAECRVAGSDASSARPLELRALGELDRRDEMVRTFQMAARAYMPMKSLCEIIVFSFAGRVGHVETLLKRPPVSLDYDAQTYFRSIARLRQDEADEVARKMLEVLIATAVRSRTRKSAERNLTARKSTPLSIESLTYLDSVVDVRAAQKRDRKEKFEDSKHRPRLTFWASLWVIAIGIILDFVVYRR